MDRLVVRGKKKLSGGVTISGAKNAAVAVIPAAIMANDVCITDNLPCIEDVKCLYTTLNKMGVECTYLDKHTLKIDSSKSVNTTVTFDEVRKMRASYYLLGALLARFKRAKVAMPGGCNFGTRPIDLHLKGFRALGAEVEVEGEIVCINAQKLKGAGIYMDTVSVGATINIMLAATMAEGVTTIENAAKEPHIVDVANFLNMMGAKIKGAGTDVIKIIGVEHLHGAEYTIIPDQIEAGTYMIAAAITGGRVTVNNIIPKHMESLSAKLTEIGILIDEGDDFITVDAVDRDFKATSIRTMAYPGFPTDLQPQIAALLSICKGTSMLTENVWEKRYQYIDELKRLGAKITVEGRVAIIEGVRELTGAFVEATDLRAGAAMIIAALSASGETVIGEVKYIDRGYEEVEKKFSALGADIQRVSV